MVWRASRTRPSGLASALASRLTRRVRQQLGVALRVEPEGVAQQRRTLAASMASRISQCAMRNAEALPSASPSTMTTLPSSSMPAEAEARAEYRLQSLSTAASLTASRATSPSATATPSAEAPRE